MKACAFCCSEEAAASAEHIWAAWIGKFFRQEFGTKFRFETHGTKSPHRRWRSRSVNLRAHVVCESCNNDWMSDLQNHVKPFLKPIIFNLDDHVLDTERQVALAAWCFMTTVVIDHAADGSKPYFLPQIRRSFMLSLDPPSDTRIWIVANDGRPRGVVRRAQVRPVREFARQFTNLFVATFLIGHFGFQVVVPRWKTKAVDRVLPASPIEAFRDATIQVYPPSPQAVAWPPSAILRGEGFDSFLNRWGKPLSK